MWQDLLAQAEGMGSWSERAPVLEALAARCCELAAELGKPEITATATDAIRLIPDDAERARVLTRIVEQHPRSRDAFYELLTASEVLVRIRGLDEADRARAVASFDSRPAGVWWVGERPWSPDDTAHLWRRTLGNHALGLARQIRPGQFQAVLIWSLARALPPAQAEAVLAEEVDTIRRLTHDVKGETRVKTLATLIWLGLPAALEVEAQAGIVAALRSGMGMAVYDELLEGIARALPAEVARALGAEDAETGLTDPKAQSPELLGDVALSQPLPIAVELWTHAILWAWRSERALRSLVIRIPIDQTDAVRAALCAGRRTPPDLVLNALDLGRTAQMELPATLDRVLAAGRQVRSRDTAERDQAVEQLVEAVDHLHPVVRQHALEYLAGTSDPRAEAALLRGLVDSVADVRREAAHHLESRRSVTTTAPLMALLPGTGSSVEADLAQELTVALQLRAHSWPVEPLLWLLLNANMDVRSAVESTLDEIDDDAIVAGSPSIELVVEIIRRNPHDLRMRAAGWLGRLRALPILDVLLALLADERPDVRSAALDVLADLGDPSALEPLIQNLAAADPAQRRSAVLGLQRFASPRVIDLLIAARADRDARVRWSAVKVLGEIGDDRAGAAVVGLLTDRDADIRCAVADALAEIGGADAIMPLCRAQQDDNTRVGMAARDALLAMCSPRQRRGGPIPLASVAKAVATETSMDSDLAARLLEYAAEAAGRQADDQTARELQAVLQHPHPSVRRAAPRALGSLGSPSDLSDVEALTRALGDEDGYVRRAAAAALRQTEGMPRLEPLLAALDSPDPDVRRYAADALGKLGDVRATEPLRAALDDPESEVRRAALTSLVALQVPGVLDLLRRAMHDASNTVRATAISLLGRLRSPEARELLRSLLDDSDTFVQRIARRTLDGLASEQAE